MTLSLNRHSPLLDLGMRWKVAIAVVAVACFYARLAAASTTFGSLSNFDVFNDTGQDCHGFEIELDGVSSADVTYTFGAPYERYGNPKLVDFPGGVFVRYESTYDPVAQAFTQATPQAPATITPTDGHACWTGGSGNYLTAGCEHFGLGVNGNPTNTTYRWLIADPTTPGALQPSGTKVSIPAPVWNVVPQPVGPPIVQAAVPAEPPEVEAQFGDATWVKVFVTESAEPNELHHLVTDDPVVPQDAGETETEWAILQADPSGGGANNELMNEAQIGAGSKSVVRRYELYAYTGAYDPESHEVMCGGNGSCNNPQAGELGNYLGAQMAALNLEALPPCATVPTKPVLLTPWKTKGVAKLRPRLSWGTATCADTYSVIVRQDARNGAIVDQPAAQTSTTYKVAARLPRGHTYYWRVNACDSIGCKQSSIWQFDLP